ncbi:MAG: chemotaxis-specific protein-glutamate methyltransferase CheB [Planctomycetaceae bacterium]|nr:chemotaxis-specific protein-glutamate methyltransferase CheB [Planctomycetaceae bacterium]
MNQPRVKVLVVDDSAYVRKVFGQMLGHSPDLAIVGIARDGAEALELIERLQPDVVTLDLVMPGLDGISFLRAQAERRPVPVVVVSMSPESSALVLQALELGAVDFVQKPTALATERLFEIQDELTRKILAAARARVQRFDSLPRVAGPVEPTEPTIRTAFDAIVIGVSTGGPQALRYLIPQLPASLAVPVAIALHMPPGYTPWLSGSLNDVSELEVVEAVDGMPLCPGRVMIAPGGSHLRFRRVSASEVLAIVSREPKGTPHYPSVDVLFRSAAETYNDRVLAAVLTGMGSDGTEGAAWVKANGGTVITESEETCVVYGMPRSVVEAGLSDRSIPLGQLPRTIREMI